MRLGGIYVDVGARTKRLARDLKKAKGMAAKTAVLMRQELGRIGFRQVAIGATIFAGAMALVGKRVIDVGRSFESTMKTVQAWSGASEQGLAALTAEAKKMGATTEWSATQSAGALKFLAAAGFSTEQSISALAGTIDLATAGQVDLASATDITTDVLTAFGLEVEELNRVNDAFITTSSSSNTNVMMLGESFKMVAPTAKLFGLNVEQTAAMLGTLANSGVKATMAGSGLNMVLLKSAQAAKKLGMDAGTPLIEVLREMNKQQWGAVQIGEAFGARQVKTASILMSNIDTYEKLTKKILENKGATEDLATIIRDSLDNDFKILHSTIEDQMLRVYDDYKEEMRDLVQGTSLWIQQNTETIDSVAELSRAFLAAAGSIGKVVAVGVAFGNVWTKTWQALGLASAGQMTYTEALLIGANKVDEFNEKIEQQNEKLIKNAELKTGAASGGIATGGGAVIIPPAEVMDTALAELVAAEEMKFQAALYAQTKMEEMLAVSHGKMIEAERVANQERLSFYENTAGQIAGTFLQISQAGGKQSAKAFKIYQAFAIAQAGISAAMAYTKTLAEPLLPWPGNVAMANIIAGMAAVQIGLIAAAKPPSFDTGGISTTPGVYYAGVPEAHIPLQGGAVPVELSGGGGSQVININMTNPTFQDVETQRQVFAQIAEVIVKKTAPSAVMQAYNNDHPSRDRVRGRG